MGPRALVEQQRLLPDAVTQQPTGTKGAGAPSVPSRHEEEAELEHAGASGSAKPRPLGENYVRPPRALGAPANGKGWGRQTPPPHE